MAVNENEMTGVTVNTTHTDGGENCKSTPIDDVDMT